MDITLCEGHIAQGPRLWRRELFPPTPSMPQPASAQEPAPHHPPRHDEVGWMLHPILGQIPNNFFSEAVGEPPHAAAGKAPTDEQAEPPVQPPAADLLG